MRFVIKSLLTVILTLAFYVSAFAAAIPETRDIQQDELNKKKVEIEEGHK